MRIPLSVVEDPSRTDLAAMSEAELAVWRELRGVFFHPEYCHPEFDPRRVLELEGATQEASRERRRERLAKGLRGRPARGR